LNVLITAIGVSLLLEYSGQKFFGAAPRTFPAIFPMKNFQLGSLVISTNQLAVIVIAVLLMLALQFIVYRTKIGTAMRALANDREITAMLGVPVRRVEAAAWFGSGIVCGIAGLLLSNLVSLDIVSLTFLVIPALAAALIGQLKSLWVTLAAGFVIGLVQSCLTAFKVHVFGRNLAEYRTMTPFVLAILALLWFARSREMVRT
jgi:branched-chain amino acid transport system permease protein